MLTFPLFSFSQSSKANQSVNSHEDDFSRQQSIIKQGWSTLTALHTVLLPDCVVAAGANTYQPPMVEILARRWQDRCQEVRLTRVDQKYRYKDSEKQDVLITAFKPYPCLFPFS